MFKYTEKTTYFKFAVIISGNFVSCVNVLYTLKHMQISVDNRTANTRPIYMILFLNGTFSPVNVLFLISFLDF